MATAESQVTPYPPGSLGKSQQEMSIRVFLCDDDELLRGCLQVALQAAGIVVVGQSHNGESLLQQVELLTEVDVLLVRDVLPDLSCSEVVEELRNLQLEPKVVCLTTSLDHDTLVSAYRAGVDAFVTKRVTALELVDRIATVNAGKKWIDPEVSELLMQSLLGPTENDEMLASLSPRESKVLQLIATGKTTKGIASELEIASSTVSVYRREICRKLNLHSIAEITKFAVRHGLADL